MYLTSILLSARNAAAHTPHTNHLIYCYDGFTQVVHSLELNNNIKKYKKKLYAQVRQIL